MGGKNQFYSWPLPTAVESLILNKKYIKTFWCNLNLFFFLSTFTLCPWCHPSRELWAEYIILELLPRKWKDNMLSKLLNPVFLTAFLRPILIAKIWEGYLEHAKSRTKIPAVSLLFHLALPLYNITLEKGLQEGCESSTQIPWLLSNTVEVPSILSNGSVTIF